LLPPLWGTEIARYHTETKKTSQLTTNSQPVQYDTDVVLIGAGIMSATLSMILKQLQPDITITIFERLDVAAAESSDAWNNAGTGHSAFCELNYTPQKPDGSIDTSKAVKVAESFEVSRQFWSYLIQEKILSNPGSFIRRIPHMSFVLGDKNMEYLQKRYEALQQYPLFQGMEYTDDPLQVAHWVPLMMEGRSRSAKVAATCMYRGTDVNFGSLTRCMFGKLRVMDGVHLYFHKEVHRLNKQPDGSWQITVKDTGGGKKDTITTKFVFIGAGGGSLPLLLKSDIPEGRSYGGFPVSGQWLRCTNTAVIEKHHAKVYGKAAIGSPPMSVPHLDTRIINGKKSLLFGPFAGFSTKFLKTGSFLDLFKSIRPSNILPMMAAGIHNIPLTRYLIQQVRQSDGDRLAALREFVPGAKMEDWEQVVAGQRVQVIKKDEEEGGILEFGTEVVNAADGSLAALLGASPGASTVVSIMLNLLQHCFPVKMRSGEWMSRLQQMIPSYGLSMAEDARLCEQIRAWTDQVLQLAVKQPI
jgi:malate dehydrogenase (quinone)